MSRDWGAQFEILLNKSSPVSKWELMSLIRSEVNCPRLIKFGADEESNGHYVCNPEINAHQWHMCLIYSIGVRDSPNFETDFLNFTEHRCWNVLVDEDPIETDLARTWSVEGRVEKFSKRDKNITSLIDLMHKYRHSVLDILKFDIDGGWVQTFQDIMKTWTAAPHIFPYSFNEVASVFWDRYPNSYAKHIMSEDVLECKVDKDQIRTKKLIVKKGASFLKSAPQWMSRLVNIKVIPTIEESVYDRLTGTLTTYTRNVSCRNLFHMEEKCLYKSTSDVHALDPMARTELTRHLYVNVTYGRINSLIERVLVMTFTKSVKRTVLGLTERLEERYGSPIIQVPFRSHLAGFNKFYPDSLLKASSAFRDSIVSKLRLIKA
ncbi:hypothetical protein QR680_001001 [Steinernema hermaphroditum]|uniref:PRELI/MSF1 domain-containing protein n=1 Tax=Steinernema hermaphroditum TaxID=289476 RepID=A0AA39GXD3_9BILA|nr:hypothetical protein QR680_001001 [Steinernema hermaphroditum]